MKIKILTTLLFLICLNLLRSQTYITSSNTVICVGESATLTANHDFLHNWCVWTPGPSTTTQTLVISPTITTTYSVTCYDVDVNPSYASFSQSVAICLGLPNNSTSTDLKLYPNPTKTEIVLIGLENKSTVQLYDLTGKLLFSYFTESEKTEVSLRDYEPGIYFIKITSGKQETVRKIIKQ